MARPFKRKGELFVGRLDPIERGLVTGLMEQVVELLDPPTPETTEGDAFDQIVAGLGGLGMGVSLAGEDQSDQPGASGERRNDAHDDPALGRLLPEANREDPEAAAEFRRYTEDGLRSRKADNLRTAVRALSVEDPDGKGRVVLTAPEALATVVALTDVRLVIGERLGLRTDEDADLLAEALADAHEDDPAVYAMAVYDFLTWLQESLATTLLR